MKLDTCYRVYKSQPRHYIPSQFIQVDALTLHLFNIYFNSILPFKSCPFRWCLSFRYSDRNFVCISLLPMLSTHPSHLFSFPFTYSNNFFEYKWWSSSLSSFLHPSVFYPLVTFSLIQFLFSTFCSPNISTLKMVTTRSSKMLVSNHHVTRHNSSENQELYSQSLFQYCRAFF